MKCLIGLMVLICALFICAPCWSAEFLLTNVNVIPMTDSNVLTERDVLIRDGRFAAIEPHGALEETPDVETIDGSGKYLFPGLMDMHVHLNGRMDVQPDMLYLYASNGVTTVLTMAGNHQVLKLAAMTENGELLGPRIFTTAPIMGNLSPNPATAEKAHEMVQRYADAGYRYLKVYNQIPEAGYWGIIEAAKEHDMTVVGHAVRSVGIEGALKAGQHIVHMEEFIYGYFQDGLDESQIEPLARRVKDAGIVVIPNLIAYHNIIRQVEDLDAMIASEGVELLPWRLRKDFPADKNSYTNRFDMDDVREYLRPNLEFMQKLTKAFEDAGVPLLAGTDAVMNIVVPGFSLHDDLQELVDAGLTPYEALQCATVNPARFLEIDTETGTIELGKAADAILLGANPLDDIANTRKIAGVFVNGEWLDSDDIHRQYEQIEARAKQSEP